MVPRTSDPEYGMSQVRVKTAPGTVAPPHEFDDAGGGPAHSCSYGCPMSRNGWTGVFIAFAIAFAGIAALSWDYIPDLGPLDCHKPADEVIAQCESLRAPYRSTALLAAGLAGAFLVSAVVAAASGMPSPRPTPPGGVAGRFPAAQPPSQTGYPVPPQYQASPQSFAPPGVPNPGGHHPAGPGAPSS